MLLALQHRLSIGWAELSQAAVSDAQQAGCKGSTPGGAHLVRVRVRSFTTRWGSWRAWQPGSAFRASIILRSRPSCYRSGAASGSREEALTCLYQFHTPTPIRLRSTRFLLLCA